MSIELRMVNTEAKVSKRHFPRKSTSILLVYGTPSHQLESSTPVTYPLPLRIRSSRPSDMPWR
ncbi:hypothetical protein FRC02_000933 [Tulasnella sp. 418]|nr:hypothetical protein FRC02_000933 [Tulasnella sp. 418]